MDEFRELNEAKELIAAFQRSSGSVGGDCSGILAAVRAKIDAYIRRRNEQRQNV
jgi:hypothetical protein